MKLHTIAPADGAVRSTKRLGRGIGSGHGKTSGKGHNGQWARSGGGVRPGFEGGQMPLTRRLPKRGFNNPFRLEYSIVNVKDLEIFEPGTIVDAELLLNNRIIGKLLSAGLKVLGEGTLTKALTIRATKFSNSAVEKIEKAGGKIEKVGVKTEKVDVKTEKVGVKTEKVGVKTEKVGVKTEKVGVKTEKAGGKTEKAGVKTEKAG